MKLYVAVDECHVKGNAERLDEHFNCVVIEAFIPSLDKIATSVFTPAECTFHNTLYRMVNDKLGEGLCEGYWSYSLEGLGRKLDKHGFCKQYSEAGAVLFIEASEMSRCELQGIVDNAIRATDVANEEITV